jgi:hypothetical protein
MAKTNTKNAEKKEAESQETPKVASEEPKGTRYLTKPVRLSDLPRLAGRKPIDPSKRLFMKLAFVALAAPGSFAVMPSRGFGAFPVCDGPASDGCGLVPDQPGTGSCNQPETDLCTQESICPYDSACNQNQCASGTHSCTAAGANSCNAELNNVCFTSNSCTVSNANTCSVAKANICSGTNTCSGGVAPLRANNCSAGESNQCTGMNPGGGHTNTCFGGAANNLCAAGGAGNAGP